MRTLMFRLNRTLAVALLLAVLAAPLGPAGRAVADDIDIKMDEIGRVKRGKENVHLKVDVGESGLVCQLKLKYADGNADSPDDVVSGKNGICELYFNVPDRDSVVGNAIAKLKVVTKKGKEKGKTSQAFTVRNGRS